MANSSLSLEFQMVNSRSCDWKRVTFEWPAKDLRLDPGQLLKEGVWVGLPVGKFI